LTPLFLSSNQGLKTKFTLKLTKKILSRGRWLVSLYFHLLEDSMQSNDLPSRHGVCGVYGSEGMRSFGMAKSYNCR
jgi:hypothetical protein